MKRIAFFFLPLAACAMTEAPVSEMTAAREMVAQARATAAQDAPNDVADAQPRALGERARLYDRKAIGQSDRTERLRR